MELYTVVHEHVARLSDFFLVVVSADTKWQLGKSDVKARLAHLRASGDFSDCVLVVGSGENVEVCILPLSVIMYYHMLYIYLYINKKLWVAIQYDTILLYIYTYAHTPVCHRSLHSLLVSG